ncbi:MAG: glycogen/starch synthase [Flavobacteriales bacterium]
MKKTRVLFVSQEITPYLPESHISKIARELPQAIQEKGKEIRTFMPRFGCINERRNQLHEVIRLSGMNLIIDDNDQPLIIKVASIQPARMQVYFIDNDEYFQRKAVFGDTKTDFFEDNDERMLFFCKGVLETVKKLGWSPDVIHCQGWMTSLIPLLIKTNYRDEPLFSETKIVYSLYNDTFSETLNHRLPEKLIMDGVDAKNVELIKTPTHTSLTKLAVKFSDGLVYGDQALPKELVKIAEDSSKPSIVLDQNEEGYAERFSVFYDEVALGEPVAELAN